MCMSPREQMECKIWIEGRVELAWNKGFSKSELNDIFRMIEAHISLINQTYEQLLA